MFKFPSAIQLKLWENIRIQTSIYRGETYHPLEEQHQQNLYDW